VRGHSLSLGKVKDFHISISSRLSGGVHPTSYLMDFKDAFPRGKVTGA
jgi:hypothetical protein